MSSRNKYRAKSNFNGSSRRRGGGRTQAYRPKPPTQQMSAAPSSTVKRASRGRAQTNRSNDSIGTRTRGPKFSPKKSMQSAEDRVAVFYQKKATQSEGNPSRDARDARPLSDSTNSMNWVRKEGERKTSHDTRVSFSSVVGRADTQANCENQPPPRASSPNKINANPRRGPIADENGRLRRDAGMLRRAASDPSVPTPKPQRVQRRPPFSSSKRPMHNRVRSQSPKAKPYVPPEAISRAVSEHHEHLRSQIGDLVKKVNDGKQENEDLSNQLNLKTAEITRLQAERAQEKRAVQQERRETSDRWAGRAQKLQSLGIDPECLEKLKNPQETQDRVLFLRERLLQSEQDCVLFQQHQQDLLNKICEQRQLLRQFMTSFKTDASCLAVQQH